MQDSERRNYEMLARVRDFHSTRATSFPAASRGSELFAELGDTLREIEVNAEAKVSHASAAAQGTANRSAARASLRASLEALSRTARAMSLDTLGLDKRFQMPRGNSDQSLLITAHVFFTNAEPFKAEFIRNELAPTFHDDLRALISDFEQSITTQNQSRGARVSATRGVKTAVEHGVELVRRLDAVVRNKFAADPASLAAWESASHVERAPRRSKTKPTSNNNPPPSP
jgi:hypothetical protein